MVHFPKELLARVINLVFANEDRSPKALGAVSLSFRAAKEIAQSLQFRTMTISTYFDITVRRMMAEEALGLFRHTKTLRVVRLMADWEEEYDSCFENG